MVLYELILVLVLMMMFGLGIVGGGEFNGREYVADLLVQEQVVVSDGVVCFIPSFLLFHQTMVALHFLIPLHAVFLNCVCSSSVYSAPA